MATVRSSELLAKLELKDLNLFLREREGFTGLDKGSILVVQSEKHVRRHRGQSGPRYHGSPRRKKTAMNGSSRQLTLKKGSSGNQV